MKNLLFLTSLLAFSLSQAQVTQIPDANFEQKLIDLNIDSDGIINGQVLTSDIAQVSILEIPDANISDLTGIEDFTALENLNISGNPLVGDQDYPSFLDLSIVPSLKNLRMNGKEDNITVDINKLILNNNPNLEEITINYNWAIQFIDLQGSDISLNNLMMVIDSGYPDFPEVCVQVSNPTQAANGQGIYATWSVSENCSFSANCNLSTQNYSLEKISLYPNPSNNYFSIGNLQNSVKTVKLYNLQGKLQKEYKNQETYSIAGLAKGLYMVKIETENASAFKKLMVK